jgi:hypothetical protein
VTADSDPLIGGFNGSFSEFGAAKAFFDYLEGMRLVGGTEEVGSVAFLPTY